MPKLDHNVVINSTILFNIQCPKSIKAKKILRIFGTKVSVCSCMEVTVWKILMIRPTTIEIKSTGNDVFMIRNKASRVISATTSMVTDLTLLS